MKVADFFKGICKDWDDKVTIGDAGCVCVQDKEESREDKLRQRSMERMNSIKMSRIINTKEFDDKMNSIHDTTIIDENLDVSFKKINKLQKSVLAERVRQKQAFFEHLKRVYSQKMDDSTTKMSGE